MPKNNAEPAAEQTPEQTPEQRVLATEDAYVAAEIHSDEAALNRLVDDRFVFNGEDGTTVDKATFIGGVLAMNMVGQTIRQRTVLVEGNVALIFGTAELRLAAPDQEEHVSVLRYTAAYVERRGQWRMLALQMAPHRTARRSRPERTRRALEPNPLPTRPIRRKPHVHPKEEQMTPEQMTPEQMSHLQEFARRYTAAWCSQDAASVAAFFAPDGSLTINEGAPAVGRSAITEAAQGFMTAFPDMKVIMDDLLEGQGPENQGKVIYKWTLEGTNDGPGGTGKRVRISGFEAWEFGDDGLIAASLGTFDAAEYERQLEHGVDGP